ncbi:hypothetical protein [Pedobacter sp. MC2016-24]|uniref:hypothetical protein n=1 Tax=Pedobacter sp. MC2016-24 TaxID=2780090 RepID=UPI00187F0E85|nr:hypothetical protein [Pedobacter sp. MC2016-24]MBE9601483.1 hypothetical protein [Pedobacter sp. MC2016-24]
MDYRKFLKITRKKNIEVLDTVKGEAEFYFNDPEKGASKIDDLLQLFHSCYSIDKTIFLTEIFYENQRVLRNTYDHRDLILEDMDKLLKDSEEAKDKRWQIRVINVYRSIVSELYDPALAIIVGCLKMREGSFTNFTNANLSMSESQKWNFAKSKLKKPSILEGYLPLIRNAVSHAGTHSIVYEEEQVVFRKIQRSENPEIVKVVKISNGELWGKLRSMLDFIVAMNAAIEIFALDTSDDIFSDERIKSAFMRILQPTKLYERWKKEEEAKYLVVWESTKLKDQDKIDYFLKKFVDAGAGKLKEGSVILNNKEGIFIIRVPVITKNKTTEDELLEQLKALIMICVLAHPFFSHRYRSFLLEEVTQEGGNAYQVWIQGDDIRDFLVGKASIEDLLHDGKIYRNRQDANVWVDFSALEERELKSLAPVLARKKRKQMSNN